MDIKLECVDLLVCALVFVCVRLCVVHKLPTDKSPREVLEQVCVGLVWESEVEMCTVKCSCGFRSAHAR